MQMKKRNILLGIMSLFIGILLFAQIAIYDSYASEDTTIDDTAITLDAQVIINEDGSTALNSISGTITGTTVNVRADASTAAEKAGSVSKDMVVTIDAQKEDSSGDMWYRIFSSANGTEVIGFVRYDFLSITDEIVVLTENVSGDTATPETSDEPEVMADYEVTYSDAWYLYEAATGESYNIVELLSVSDQSKVALAEAEAEVKQQKTSNIILVIILIIVLLLLGGLVFNFRDDLLGQLFDAPPNPNAKKRTNQNRGQKPANSGGQNKGGTSTRPVPPTSRPVPPTSRPVPPASRPAPPNRRPVPNRTQQSGEGVKRPPSTSQNDSRNNRPQPTDKPAIKKQTEQRMQEQEHSNRLKDTEQKWKAKNFIDNDEFEFEFIDLNSKE